MTRNLHQYADREMGITCTCIVQRNFLTSDFAPDCRGTVKRGLTVLPCMHVRLGRNEIINQTKGQYQRITKIFTNENFPFYSI